jgi:hypothetical protein
LHALQSVIALIGFFFGFSLFSDTYGGLTVAIFFILVYRLFIKSNDLFVFREWVLILYCINYLLSPLITYSIPAELVTYPMKIPQLEYFNLAFWGFVCFGLGIYTIPNRLFQVNYKNVKNTVVLNEMYLKRSTILFILIKLMIPLLPGELGFFMYLISLLRFVTAFSVFAFNPRLWYYPFVVLSIEFFGAFLSGMYHDAIMWFLFFCIYFIYTKKPNIRVKLIGVCGVLTLILFIQAMKAVYRSEVWRGEREANVESLVDIGSNISNSETLLGEDNLLGTLTRSNQAWIFASTVERMDRFKDFQGLHIMGLYLEAAILPRFISPNKIKSGDKKIFNEFSGHYLNSSTSMGLGIFADGYIAYGVNGVYVFGFFFGLLFSVTFKIVESWTKDSPFYVLLLLPLLNYAVRPDCESQTIINHLFKGLIVFNTFVYLSRKRFTLDSRENHRKLGQLGLLKGGTS